MDDGNEKYCFVKAEAIKNLYENRELATKLILMLD